MKSALFIISLCLSCAACGELDAVKNKITSLSNSVNSKKDNDNFRSSDGRNLQEQAPSNENLSTTTGKSSNEPESQRAIKKNLEQPELSARNSWACNKAKEGKSVLQRHYDQEKAAGASAEELANLKIIAKRIPEVDKQIEQYCNGKRTMSVIAGDEYLKAKMPDHCKEMKYDKELRKLNHERLIANGASPDVLKRSEKKLAEGNRIADDFINKNCKG